MSLDINRVESCREEYRRKGYWGDATLEDYFRFSVLRFPGKTAVVDRQGTSYTYSQLDMAAAKVAAFLKDTGVIPGDTVSIQLPGWAEFTVIYTACLKAGAVMNPILPNYQNLELLYVLNKCKSKVCFIPSSFRSCDFPAMYQSIEAELPYLKRVVVIDKEKRGSEGLTLADIFEKYKPLSSRPERDADDLAAVLFTSGTEGSPKGVMLTHNNIISSERDFAALINLTYYDVMFMPSPVSHATGFHHGVTAPLMVGAKSVLLDRFKADTCLELIDREKCTCSMGSTPFIHDILKTMPDSTYDISSLRYFFCGGAPIPRDMMKQAHDSGIRVVAVYGSTESVPHAMTLLDDPYDKIINTDGKAVPCTEIRVVDEMRRPVGAGVQGEEASRGPNVFVGYLDEPELTAKVLDDDGWYYSGDYCTMDQDGYIRITGRKKDVIVRGGENISCIEIEGILCQMPEIEDACVVSMPDPRLGERICAYVVLKKPNIEFALEDVKAFFSGKRLAKCKYPERIEIIDDLPRVASGKVKKEALRIDIKNKLQKESGQIAQGIV